MIKKWNNFITESYSDKELSDMKDKVGEFIGEEEINKMITTEFVDSILSSVLKYTDWRYDNISKEMHEWVIKNLGDLRHTDGSISLIETIKKKSYGDKSSIIHDLVNFYSKIKDEFDDSGYPKESQLSKDVTLIAVSTLDNLEFEEVYENFDYLFMRVTCNGIFNINTLSLLESELVPMCGRIKDQTKLTNESLDFSDQDRDGKWFEILLSFRLS